MSEGAKRAVVITGASTGIGEACVRLLVEKDFLVFGSVRTAADAERLKAQFGENYAPLRFDVTDGDEVARAAVAVEEQLQGATLVGLVNNAGMAVAGPLLHVPIEELRRQLEVNVIGQMRVTQAFAPLLGARASQGAPPGRIVNMSSVAGRMVGPLMGPYSASKFALEAMSDALRRELAVYGIAVVVIEPGIIATPIWDKAESAAFDAFDRTIYGPAARRVQKWAVDQGRTAVGPERVAEAVHRALVGSRPPLRILVLGGSAFHYYAQLLIPPRLMDWLMARYFGFDQVRRTLVSSRAAKKEVIQWP
ncbi:SDR family oxidoreductase [Methylocystis sp. SC2]|uniref:SDR family oxidoreductase n=1 Tax=Methylocystis sp. (strain SC2) TaxID=187303 RepID=UPI00027AEB8F|nr:SDR family oxidoreductase [Methylocystis sp. SC2]CCJ06880.1 Short chain dehydrogenase/reductase (SDR) family protein [Methylocystis sp. SC2]